MYKFNLKILLRSIRNKPVYFLISILGFTIGITASLLIYFWVVDELSYEKFHPGHERIYRVLTLSKQGNKIVKSASSYRPIAYTMKQSYPQVEDATFISFSSEDSPLKIKGSTKKIESRLAWIDDNFFNVFQGFLFVEGDMETALNSPDKVILSEKVAKKLFGEELAIGKTVICDKFGEDSYEVGAVVHIPDQSHIDVGFLLSYKASGVYTGTNWRKSAHAHVYIKLYKNALIDDTFRRQVSGHVGRYSPHTDKLMFQPLDDIHLYSDYDNFFHDKKISDIKYVWIFSGLALLIILMASLNFAFLTTARASERATEIGIRKVSGSAKSSMVAQLIVEALIQTLIATILALVLIAFLLPWFSNLTGKDFSNSISFGIFGSIFLISVLVGLFSGLYPAFYLTSFNTIASLRGGNLTGSKVNFIRSLVMVQFIIAIILLVSTGTVFKQLQYIRNFDLGFDKEDIVVIPTGLWYSIGSFKQELLDNPNILSVSANNEPIANSEWLQGFHWRGQDLQDTVQANMFWVDEDFAKTYNIELVRGIFLQQDYSNYWKQQEKAYKYKKNGREYPVSMPVVINEAFARLMNGEDPIGIRLNKEYVIVGVAKDFNYRSLHNKISPVVMLNDPQCIGSVSVKIEPEKRSETLVFIRNVYKKYREGRGFSYSYFEDELEQKYRAENRLGRLITHFSILALIIAMLGILGLSSFATKCRLKEIGVRKVHGAKLIEILAMLCNDFAKWLLLSFVAAAPISWYIMHRWMQNFAYKTTLSWWIFALAGLLALGIALLTVSWQSWRAATRNPVEALRYE